MQKSARHSLNRQRRHRERTKRARRTQLGRTERSLAERLHGHWAARQAEESCARFAEIWAGTTVHNLRGVLTPAKVHANALLQHSSQGKVDAKKVNELAGKIVNRIAFAERLLDDMRTFAQPATAERRPEPLCEIVTEACATVTDYLRAQERDASTVTLVVAVPEDVTVELARHQIVVALANVLKNAYEALADNGGGFGGGIVSVIASLRDRYVQLVVQDTGPGLTLEDLRELREFVPGRTTKKNRGTGYGLPIARRYVLAHRGTFAIDSQPNAGTTVTISLPLGREQSEDVCR